MIYDALVIGGGPAGATTALLLAQAGWSVALVEKHAFPRRKVCGEFISATSLPLLRALGVADAFLASAGPEIRRVGIFAGGATITAPMPVPRSGPFLWGRALGREHLDMLLLQSAVKAGVEVWQPWTVNTLQQTDDRIYCELSRRQPGVRRELQARIAVAAQGSWETGTLPGQTHKTASASDLFGFKGHFENADLPPDLMTLLAFPGGYGGLVHTDAGRLSLSCCVRRDRLHSCRGDAHGKRAAEVVLSHILASCRGARAALQGARLHDQWLAVGPIRPGTRPLRDGRVFLTGNAAGEAHPVIAEGISLAVQGAWLLAQNLIRDRDLILGGQLAATAHRYAAAWHRHFSARVHRSAVFAQIAMRPALTAAALPLFRLFPQLLTVCTRSSGKVHFLPASADLGASVSV